MTQPLLKAEQHRLFVAPFRIDDPVGMKARAGERRGKKIAPAQTPKDRAFEVREHARGKEHGGRAMHRAEPAAGYLMQRAKGEPALRQAGIDFFDAERKDRIGRPSAVL